MIVEKIYLSSPLFPFSLFVFSSNTKYFQGVKCLNAIIVFLCIAHQSPSLQRVSPPTSDFDIEGITIIDSALSRYQSKMSGDSSYSDRSPISRELGNSLTPPQFRRGGRDSYGAMLKDYTSRSDQLESNSRGFYTEVSASPGVVENGNGNEIQGTRNPDLSSSEGLEYSIALSLNYEVGI